MSNPQLTALDFISTFDIKPLWMIRILSGGVNYFIILRISVHILALRIHLEKYVLFSGKIIETTCI